MIGTTTQVLEGDECLKMREYDNTMYYDEIHVSVLVDTVSGTVQKPDIPGGHLEQTPPLNCRPKSRR